MNWAKWSYMDHWVTETPQGPQPPSFNRAYMDRYVKQLAALGFTGFDTFFFYLPIYAGMYGSVRGFESYLQRCRLRQDHRHLLRVPIGDEICGAPCPGDPRPDLR